MREKRDLFHGQRRRASCFESDNFVGRIRDFRILRGLWIIRTFVLTQRPATQWTVLVLVIIALCEMNVSTAPENNLCRRGQARPFISSKHSGHPNRNLPCPGGRSGIRTTTPRKRILLRIQCIRTGQSLPSRSPL